MKATQKNKLTVLAFAFALAAVFAIAVGCSQNPAESGSDEDAPAVEQGTVSVRKEGADAGVMKVEEFVAWLKDQMAQELA